MVNLNADPHELATAIKMAAANKVYLSPEAAEMLLSDISGSIDPSRGAGGTIPRRAAARWRSCSSSATA